MKNKAGRKDSTVSITHYAPDITLTAVDYYIPISHEQRMQKAEQRIKEFLAKTNPDSLCEGFYDRYAAEEEELIIAMVREQAPDHNDANASIAMKHRSEIERLDHAIEQVTTAISGYETEIAALLELYNLYN